MPPSDRLKPKLGAVLKPIAKPGALKPGPSKPGAIRPGLPAVRGPTQAPPARPGSLTAPPPEVAPREGPGRPPPSKPAPPAPEAPRPDGAPPDVAGPPTRGDSARLEREPARVLVQLAKALRQDPPPAQRRALLERLRESVQELGASLAAPDAKQGDPPAAAPRPSGALAAALHAAVEHAETLGQALAQALPAMDELGRRQLMAVLAAVAALPQGALLASAFAHALRARGDPGLLDRMAADAEGSGGGALAQAFQPNAAERAALALVRVDASEAEAQVRAHRAEADRRSPAGDWSGTVRIGRLASSEDLPEQLVPEVDRERPIYLIETTSRPLTSVQRQYSQGHLRLTSIDAAGSARQWVLERQNANHYLAKVWWDGYPGAVTTSRTAKGPSVEQTVSGKAPSPDGKRPVAVQDLYVALFGADGLLSTLERTIVDQHGSRVALKLDFRGGKPVGSAKLDGKKTVALDSAEAAALPAPQQRALSASLARPLDGPVPLDAPPGKEALREADAWVKPRR